MSSQCASRRRKRPGASRAHELADDPLSPDITGRPEARHGRDAGSRSRYTIAMCSDFFFPRLGGVEMHIWSLSQCLMRLGHKVIVVTHSLDDRKGVRYMRNGLKVYYLPMAMMVDGVICPTLYAGFALLRKILIRERVQIVHGHQATSTFMHECLLHARAMGCKTVYTDHSLFGFADAASVHLNKLMKFTLSDVDHAIAVSHTCRENLVLRAALSPSIVAAIPNAVDSTKFPPKMVNPSFGKERTRSKATNLPFDEHPRITVVIISRLVYRKGVDLVVQAIPLLAQKVPNMHFIIGGDGNKKLLLEEMREKYRLHDRIELLGAVPHNQVRDVLARGDIFLNCSLTESFCIAILEAASCGLFVVSTRVGGVSEVLPPDMIVFSKAITPEAVADAVVEAIPRLRSVDPMRFHDRVKKMYNWNDVAERTEKIYHTVIRAPVPTLHQRFVRYSSIGPIAGILACILISLMVIYHRYLEWKCPAERIEEAPDFPAREKWPSAASPGIHKRSVKEKT